MATFKKRGDGWYVQVRRKGFPAQYRTFRIKADAQAWARELEARIDRGALPASVRLQDSTLGDLLRRYDTDVVPRLRGAAQETIRLKKMLRAPICALTLDALTPSSFAAYRDARLAEVMPQTVKHELALFGRIIVLARREWDVPLVDNPVKRIALPIVHNSRQRRLEAGEAERLMEALRKTRNRLVPVAVTLAMETAMRRGELLALEWRHVDLKRRIALLPLTKNGRPREVPLTDEAVRVLGSLPEAKDESRVLPLTPMALRLAWVRATKRAGLEDLHFHDLRHEAISRFAELGLSATELALISGHRDLRMLNRYTHLRPTDLAAKLAGRSWADETKRPKPSAATDSSSAPSA